MFPRLSDLPIWPGNKQGTCSGIPDIPDLYSGELAATARLRVLVPERQDDQL